MSGSFAARNVGPFAFDASNAVSTNAFSFSTPKPTGFGGFGGGPFASSESGSIFGGTSAGTSGANAFAFTTLSTKNAFGGSLSWPFRQLNPTTTFGAISAAAYSPPVPIDTSMPAYSITTDWLNPPEEGASVRSSPIGHFVTITAMLAYRSHSLEELRLQDYQRGPKPGITLEQHTIDPNKRARLEELLRHSLLGEQLIDVQFHLFSAKSSPAGRVMRPRVLRANNALLAKTSEYFLGMLSASISPSDPSFVELADEKDVPKSARMDDYGYGSDSDLDECDDLIPVANSETPKDLSPNSPTTLSNIEAETQQRGDDSMSEYGFGSDFGTFVMSPMQPRKGDPPFGNKNSLRSIASGEAAVQTTVVSTISENQTTVRERSLARSRHILVKDAAFQTWYALLNYLYTDKIHFLPLSSTTDRRYGSSTSFLDEPRCSAKSMYHLASKLGLNHLRDEAFSYIQSKLTEHNILKELSCSLVSRHPKMLEMELDVLHSHIGSPPVVANFPKLARRIADKGLLHGADIMVGVHTRFLTMPGCVNMGCKRKRCTEDNEETEAKDGDGEVNEEEEEGEQ